MCKCVYVGVGMGVKEGEGGGVKIIKKIYNLPVSKTFQQNSGTCLDYFS